MITVDTPTILGVYTYDGVRKSKKKIKKSLPEIFLGIEKLHLMIHESSCETNDSTFSLVAERNSHF